ncbi:MAG TPA: hypothetical protein VMZ69_06550 [Saprospiraceae bacterium]|nr:hypothetical protein [Saprospiraceae bacterium]
MKHVLIGASLFLAQLYFTFLGEARLDKYLNPVFLLSVSAAIPAYLIWLLLKHPRETVARAKPLLWHRAVWAFGGLISVLIAYEELRKAFVKYSEPSNWSDVLTQVRVLYERFSHGEFPYDYIRIWDSYDLAPVYMPLQWLPAGFAVAFEIDLRWIGFGFFAIAVAVYGWKLASQNGTIISRVISLLLPSLPLWAYIRWGEIDLMVSFEIVVGAYYLILATGLLSKRLWLVTFGIILCVLSRYTLVFWLPLFALNLFYDAGLKKTLWVWGSVAACVLLLYIIPFYIKDSAKINRGLSYYTMATVAEWNGYGEPPVSWTHERGVSFAPHMKALFHGDMESRVHNARIVQGVMLLLVFAGSLIGYRRWRNRIDIYTFNLVALYCFLATYYFFAPLTYRYYLFSFLVFSAVLCGKIVMNEVKGNRELLDSLH